MDGGQELDPQCHLLALSEVLAALPATECVIASPPQLACVRPLARPGV